MNCLRWSFAIFATLICVARCQASGLPDVYAVTFHDYTEASRTNIETKERAMFYVQALEARLDVDYRALRNRLKPAPELGKRFELLHERYVALVGDYAMLAEDGQWTDLETGQVSRASAYGMTHWTIRAQCLWKQILCYQKVLRTNSLAALADNPNFKMRGTIGGTMPNFAIGGGR